MVILKVLVTHADLLPWFLWLTLLNSLLYNQLRSKRAVGVGWNQEKL